MKELSMNQMFDWCVEFLEYYAKEMGTTYKALNVWIFCIIEPIIFVLMLVLIIVQALKLYKRKKLIRVLIATKERGNANVADSK